jgi:uncharacterized coiled-coil protein SlyX
MKILKTCLFAFSLLVFSTNIALSQQGVSGASSDERVQKLEQRLDEQERRFKALQDALQKQSETIALQQREIESLRGKVGASDPLNTAAAKPTDPATAPSTNVQAVAKTPDAPKAAPKDVNAVESGFGKIKFNGLLQGWYSAGNGTNNTFRFRRAEMKFSGQITPKVKWTIMIDPAKALSLNTATTTVAGVPVVTSVSPNQSSRILQDAFFTLTYIKDVNVDIGQFKIPLTLEGLTSSARLDTVERALFMSDRGRGGGLGDIRDFGIQFSGPLGKQFDYQIGIFNGTGETQNIADTNQEKAVIGRFVFKPEFIKGLQIGASGAFSKADRVTNPRRDRAGGELQYINKNFKFRTEIMGAVDGDLHRLGYYTHFGYKITPKFEAIFRIDGFDPDRRRETNSANVAELDYVGGFNYYIKDHNFKFQFNYIRKTFSNGIQPSRNLFLANLQTSW